MTLSESMDLIDGLLTKTQKNIKSKPECYWPIYNLYYMVIYVAIQDSFNYGKVAPKYSHKSRHRATRKWRTKEDSERRRDASDWLLHSPDSKLMWADIADVDYSILHDILQSAYKLFKSECDEGTDINRRNAKSVEIGRRLQGLSI